MTNREFDLAETAPADGAVGLLQFTFAVITEAFTSAKWSSIVFKKSTVADLRGQFDPGRLTV
jgi:hypothetical protein